MSLINLFAKIRKKVNLLLKRDIKINIKRMGKTATKAAEVIKEITIEGKSVKEVRTLYPEYQEWFSVSNKAYNIMLDEAKKENKKNEKRTNVSSTTNAKIVDIFALNEKLSDYALGIPVSATGAELQIIEELVESLPTSEQKIIDVIEQFNMHPKWRAMQKLGRIKKYDAFKEFDKIIDAALLCYYRENYISCFLTLVPVIEGVLLRWSGYNGTGEKPEFEDHRKFFKQGPIRQPCPGNIQFHLVFSKICDSILNKALYKPTPNGDAYGDFNRHLALHLLKNSNFGTKNNCIRLFVLFDFMTEIYWYEGKFHDPRWDLKPTDLADDIDIYGNLLVDQQLLSTAEKKIFS